MSEEKCHRCGTPATRQRQVVVRSVDVEHRDLFPDHGRVGQRDSHGHLLDHHDDHHHHREVVRELRPVCESCDAKIDAEEAAFAKVAAGVAGWAALMVIIPIVLVSLGVLGASAALIWYLLR